ncbi:Protein phosphatase PP2A regulatory subunit B, partial [Coemansia sp. S2]
PPVPGQYPMPGQYPVPQYPVPANARPARPRNPRQTGGRGGYATRGGRGAGYRANPRTAQQAPSQPQEAPLADAPTSDSEQVAAPDVAKITAAVLAADSEDDKKQILGEALYPCIAAFDEEKAGKITGMLLEMDNSELLNLLEDTAALEEKVNEAVKVLNEVGPEDAE